MTIEEFIAARLKEDEIHARGAHKEGALNGDSWNVWKVWDREGLFDGGIYVFPVDAPPHGDGVVRKRDGETSHIERYDPARVLDGEIPMKRALLEQYASAKRRFPKPADDEPYSRSDIETMAQFGVLRVLIRHTAAIWSSHPDYRQEWAA
ncbi:DUF6221 family protein [Nocardia sp. NPDC050630]|uniref:DUF6221 family protein n=1 Tax=Nocardia sp. NPDC050630 TaxID=3364321 RepID=UPI00378B8565